MRTRPMAVILARLFRRIIGITIVFTYTVRRARKWVRVVFATTMAAAATAILLALVCCMKLVGPSDGVRFGRRILKVCESLHPAGEGATTAIAVYHSKHIG